MAVPFCDYLHTCTTAQHITRQKAFCSSVTHRLICMLRMLCMSRGPDCMSSSMSEPPSICAAYDIGIGINATKPMTSVQSG